MEPWIFAAKCFCGALIVLSLFGWALSHKPKYNARNQRVPHVPYREIGFTMRKPSQDMQ